MFGAIILICAHAAATMCSVAAADRVIVVPRHFENAWQCQFGGLNYAMREVGSADVVRIVCFATAAR